MSFWHGSSFKTRDNKLRIRNRASGRWPSVLSRGGLGHCPGKCVLRTAERILLCVGRFKAYSFDELFEQTKALPWEEYLPSDGKFWVKKASATKSKLFSSSDIQSIVKKAIVERLKQTYRIEWFKEDGAVYPLRVFIYKDEVTIALDTSGESLHKRGYRKLISKAPVSETLAAAILLLSPWNKDRILVDPFCGSGTFPIEAAMIGANIAPGMNREFTAEAWKNILPIKNWYEAVTEANDLIRDDVDMDIQGYDIDGGIVKMPVRMRRRPEWIICSISSSVRSAP